MNKRTLMAVSTALVTPGIIRARTRDNMLTFDRRTIDSTGAFLVGELERLDQTLNEPLVDVSWSRDIDLREDVSIADEAASFTNSTFAAVGGASPAGKAWIGKDATTIASIALDIGKTAQPLWLWGMEIGWTVPELESAQRVGRPVDSQKYDGLVLKHNMDIDEMVYIGDSVVGAEGLLNSSKVTAGNVVTVSGKTTWAEKLTLGDDVGPTQILADVNTLLTAAWAASGYAVVPDTLLLPPTQYAMLVQHKVSTAGNVSLLEYLRQNSISLARNGKPLNIQPVKWLTGRGAANTDRMVAYTKDKKRVRYPLVPLQRTPLQYVGIFHNTTYFGRLGAVEWVYPETGRYADGI